MRPPLPPRIAIIGDGSFSIDQQRYNARFGGQLFYEIRNGKITAMLKDLAYQMRTPDSWNSMDLIGGKKSYQLGGSFFDGKGQPGQVNAVSHGCVPSRFRQVNVINSNTKRFRQTSIRRHRSVLPTRRGQR